MSDFNYFAEREQESQRRFQALRDRLLEPLVRVLQRCRVTADAVSLLSLLCLLPFGVLLLRARQPIDVTLASAFLWLHVLLDALDGPLARRTGTAGPAGALTDMCVDHFGMLITTALLTAAGLIRGVVGVAYASTYTAAIVFTVWLNMLGRPFRLVLRTKYLLYGLTSLSGLLDGASTWFNAVVAGFCVVHGAYAVAGFRRVRRALREAS